MRGIMQFWTTVTAEKCRKYIHHLHKVIPHIIGSIAQQLATKLFLHVLINGCNCSCLGNKCYYGFDNNNQSVKSVINVSIRS